VVDQVFMIFAGTRGYLDDVPRTRVAEWEQDFLIFMQDQHAEIRNKIIETKDLDDATMAELVKAIGEFKAQFAGKTPVGGGKAAEKAGEKAAEKPASAAARKPDLAKTTH
jgi:hypothetical protein